MAGDHKHEPSEPITWLDNPRNVKKLLWVLYALCALIVALDFAYEKHPYFEVENIPNFWGLWGFGCFVFIVFVGKGLRKIVMRDEDYYDR